MKWVHPYDYAAARPTFIDAWPQAWNEMAPVGEIIPLNRDETNALGWQITGYRRWFVPTCTRPLLDLAKRLDEAIARQGRSSFVRLTSRSPKDSLLARRRGLRVRDGAQALALFVEGSERCAADLRMSLEQEHNLGIVVRRWIEFAPWAEFRCFMVDHHWVGASQGQHLGGVAFSRIAERARSVIASLEGSMDRVVAASPIPDAAFDLVIVPWSKHRLGSAVLLDANPLLQVTDFALFDSSSDFDLTFRFRRSEDRRVEKIPLSAAL